MHQAHSLKGLAERRQCGLTKWEACTLVSLLKLKGRENEIHSLCLIKLASADVFKTHLFARLM